MSIPLRVLILEDRPSDAELAVLELRKSGFEPDWLRVETESDYLAHLDPALDLILADYSLPQFDGLSALRLLRARGLDLPFILVSGTIGEDIAVSAMKEGADDYLLKDRLTRLGPAVKSALEQKRLRYERKRAEAVLWETASQLRAVLNNAPITIFTTDSHGIFTLSEGKGLENAGLKPGENVGGSAFDLYGSFPFVEYNGKVTAGEDVIRRALAGEEVTAITELRGVYFDNHIGPLRGTDGKVDGIVGVAIDVTERRQAEESLREANQRAIREYEQLLKRLARLAQAIGTARDLTSVFRGLREFAEASVPCNGLFVSLYSPEKQERICVYSGGDGEEDDVSMLPPMPMNDSPHSRAIATGQIVVTDDLQAALAGKPVVTLGADKDPRLPQSSLAVPLTVLGRVIGAFEVQSVQPAAYRQEHITAMSMAANLAAIAAENVQMLEHERELRLGAEMSEERIETQLQHLAALRTIDTAITGSLDLRLTLDIVLEQTTAQLNVDAASILLLRPRQNELEIAVARGFRTKAFKSTQLRLGEGYAGRAALERHSVHIPNLDNQHDNPRLAKHLAREGFVAYYGLPLIAKGQVKGVLEVFQRAPLAAGPDWVNFLETLAEQAAIAIDNASLFNSLQRSNADLTLAYDATIEGWSRAMDLRDKETEGHTQRVTEMSQRLARVMGIDEAELVNMRRGALLHDIGKMGVPDSILLKPDKLTDEEWTLMKKHPQFAFDMLSPIAYLKPALDIPYCHHERWDGTGYPRGLKGEQIPLAARIFAIVDVWDALTSDRPYRPAWPKEKVREHIRTSSGMHFDPQVVEEFLKMPN